MRRCYLIAFAFLASAFASCPEAMASGGITEFSAPLEKVVGTITGPAGRWIAIAGMAIVGLVYIFNKEDISGGVKLLLNVVFAICFIAFATSIVDSIFSFSGAVL